MFKWIAWLRQGLFGWPIVAWELSRMNGCYDSEPCTYAYYRTKAEAEKMQAWLESNDGYCTCGDANSFYISSVKLGCASVDIQSALMSIAQRRQEELSQERERREKERKEFEDKVSAGIATKADKEEFNSKPG